MNKSPSNFISNIPPWSSTKFLAIDNPSPEPSVVLEASPLLNLSKISASVKFNGYSDIFLNVIDTNSSFSSTYTYTLVPFNEYLRILEIRFWNILNVLFPSAYMVNFCSGMFFIKSKLELLILSSNSPKVCLRSATGPYGVT